MQNNHEKPLAIVIGGSGFIGSHLIELLISEGYEIHIVDIKKPQTHLDTKFIQTDIRKDITYVPDKKPELVFNLAAVHRTPGHEASEYYETNVLGSINVLNWCNTLNIKRIVFTSSIAVYGPSNFMQDEDSLLQPISDYGKSKVIAEAIHNYWANSEKNRQIRIIRPAVIFGSGENGNFTRLAKGMKYRYFFYPAGKDIKKSSGYVKDLVRCLYFSAQLDGKVIITNFAFPEVFSIGDICTSMSRIGTYAKPSSLPFHKIGTLLTYFPRPLSTVGERISKLNAQTIISTKKLVSSGFEWKYNLDSALLEWYEATEFDQKSSDY